LPIWRANFVPPARRGKIIFWQGVREYFKGNYHYNYFFWG
jgi:hypothetical protein